MRINNIDVEKAKAFVEEAKTDKSKAIKVKKVEGEWIFEEGKPQFRATLQHGNKATELESDSAEFMGGSALKPDPVQYCLFGLAACFAQTFVSIAAEKGIELQKLKVSAENKVNLAKALGLSDEPIVENVKFIVEATSQGNKDKLKEIAILARERCPGVYCLTNPIKLDVESKFE
ncbi:MAG TPA: OsmC family protein [Candidatus Nanoarchaeia archaeon]|nr:OsmC family protein [Candidatus Nanoarchaeia archaeon]